MRLSRKLAISLAMSSLIGCKQKYTVPEAPMPPNTILLSEMMRQLSAQPGFTEALLKQLDGNGNKKGPALMTPHLVDDLRKGILGNDWQHLDRFPGWTMREINPSVRVIGHEAGKNKELENASAVHPGASPSSAQANQFLDLGLYPLDKAETVSLDTPSTLPPFTTDGIVTTLGDGVTRGDGPNQLASEHSESQRLADILNRLAANKLDGVEQFQYELSSIDRSSEPCIPSLPPNKDGRLIPMDMLVPTSSCPEALIRDLQASGHTVTVQDARYFANFGHFHFKGEDVMMPFFVNSEMKVPGTRNRPLLVPVSHAELEWHIRGPKINADISYYFGIDGKSQWRTMDTLDQSWVLKRNAHTYTGADAVEVTRLTGLLTVAYMRLHAAHPTLPFGGYYALGVCQDGVSAIEHKMTGRVTLFPNTADASLFTDPRDAEVNALIAAIPKDRDGKKPEPERIFGSLPTEPDANGHFSAVTIPGLADDLNATYAAWKDGNIEYVATLWDYAKVAIFVGTSAGLALFLAWRTHRFIQRNGGQHKLYR